MKEIWNAILKLLFSKTDLDEKVADKLEKLSAKANELDKVDGDTEAEEKKEKK